MTEAAINELETKHPTWYDFEATTMEPGKKVLATLNPGALSVTALERCANG